MWLYEITKSFPGRILLVFPIIATDKAHPKTTGIIIKETDRTIFEIFIHYFFSDIKLLFFTAALRQRILISAEKYEDFFLAFEDGFSDLDRIIEGCSVRDDIIEQIIIPLKGVYFIKEKIMDMFR